MLMVKQEDIDIGQIKSWLEKTTKDPYSIDVKPNYIGFYNLASDVDDICLERFDDELFTLSEVADTDLSDATIVDLLENALDKNCFFEKELIHKNKYSLNFDIAVLGDLPFTVLISEKDLDLKKIKSYLEYTTKETYSVEVREDFISFYNLASEVDDFSLVRFNDESFTISNISGNDLPDWKIVYLLENALDKKCFFKKPLIQESIYTNHNDYVDGKIVFLEDTKVWIDGIAEGGIIHKWQGDTYVPETARYPDVKINKLIDYAKENPVILVIDTPFGFSSFDAKLTKYCTGFILNDILGFFKEDDSLFNYKNFLKDKPIMSASVLGLYAEELEHIKESDLGPNEFTEFDKNYFKKHNRLYMDNFDLDKRLYQIRPELDKQWEDRYRETYPRMFSIAKEQDGEIHYILYKDFLGIKHDPSKVKLKEGTMVRLECIDGKATVYGLD